MIDFSTELAAGPEDQEVVDDRADRHEEHERLRRSGHVRLQQIRREGDRREDVEDVDAGKPVDPACGHAAVAAGEREPEHHQRRSGVERPRQHATELGVVRRGLEERCDDEPTDEEDSRRDVDQERDPCQRDEAEQRHGDAVLALRDGDPRRNAHGHGRGIDERDLMPRERRAEHQNQYRNESGADRVATSVGAHRVAPGSRRAGRRSRAVSAITPSESRRTSRRGRPSGLSSTLFPGR